MFSCLCRWKKAVSACKIEIPSPTHAIVTHQSSHELLLPFHFTFIPSISTINYNTSFQPKNYHRMKQLIQWSPPSKLLLWNHREREREREKRRRREDLLIWQLWVPPEGDHLMVSWVRSRATLAMSNWVECSTCCFRIRLGFLKWQVDDICLKQERKWVISYWDMWWGPGWLTFLIYIIKIDVGDSMWVF